MAGGERPGPRSVGANVSCGFDFVLQTAAYWL